MQNKSKNHTLKIYSEPTPQLKLLRPPIDSAYIAARYYDDGSAREMDEPSPPYMQVAIYVAGWCAINLGLIWLFV